MAVGRQVSDPTAAVFGYDPARVIALRHRTIEAIDELAAIQCDDPLADDAVRMVRLLRFNLGDAWLPLLDALCSSRALTAWRDTFGAVGPTRVSGPRRGAGSPTWIVTTGLGHLTDDDLATRLTRHAHGLADTIRRGGDLDLALDDLRETTREARLRTQVDAPSPSGVTSFGVSFGVVLLGAVGGGGIAGLIDAFGSLHGAARAAHLPEAASTSILTDLAIVLGAVATADDTVRDALAEAVVRSPDLADAVVLHLDHFDDQTVLALTRRLAGVAFRPDTGGVGWRSGTRVVDDRPVLDELLARLADAPPMAVALLGDRNVLDPIVTDPRFEQSGVEDVVAAALAAPGVDPVHAISSLAVLADLVAIAGRSELSVGARRGIARSIGIHLPVITPHLDRRIAIDVTVHGPATDDTVVVTLGDYDAVARLMGQVADDESAQLVLGVVTAAFRDEQLARAAALLHDPGRPHDPVWARDLVAASLADVTRVIRLIDRGIDDRNRLHAFSHGSRRSSLTTITGLLTNLVSWFAPGAPLTGRIATLSSRLVNAELMRSSAPRVPDTDVEAELAVHFLVAVLLLPAVDPVARTALGLDGLADEVWDEITEIADALDHSDDPDERRQFRSRLRSIAETHPELGVHLEVVAAISGDATLG